MIRTIRSRIALKPLIFVLLITLGATGCQPVTDPATELPAPPQTSAPEEPNPTVTPIPNVGPGEQLVSNLSRETDLSVAPDQLKTLVGGNSAFALDLYRQLAAQQGNLFYSPYSISLALAMTYAGAEGDTAAQMADALHFTLQSEDLHTAFNSLDQALAERGQDVNPEQGEGFQLNIANSIWGQRGYDFRSAYLDLLAANYGAGLRVADFSAAPEESRQEINEWVSDSTEDRIQDLIPPGGVSELTRLVLANAIYFKASWMHQFSEMNTQPGPFTILDGTQVQVPMMRLLDPKRFAYADGDGFQAVQLPYVGDEVGMLIVLPDEGTFGAFEDGLDGAALDQIVDQLDGRMVQLSMPKFEFESEFGLAEALSALGMTDAFSPGAADFSGIDGGRELYVSDVFHKAFVSVDEEGTEAAAATAVIVGVTSIQLPDVTLNIDRPFLFFIRDLETGTVLFTGRVANPMGA